MPVSAITLKNVYYSFDSIFVLEDINLEIPERCYLGIIGPNGAGKTTLLRLILGIIKPHKGEVLIYGMRPQDYLKSQTIGYLPQRISQTIYEFPITVEELVKSGYERIKKHHIDWALDVFKISHLKKRSH